jgi:hypothetical protein
LPCGGAGARRPARGPRARAGGPGRGRAPGRPAGGGGRRPAQLFKSLNFGDKKVS